MIASPGWLDESKKADEPKSQFFACKGGPRDDEEFPKAIVEEPTKADVEHPN